MLVKLHQSDTERGGKGNENGVDKEKIESTQKEEPAPCSQSETSRTKWRHQGCCDGYTRYHISALAFRTKSYNAGSAAKECNHHIVESR